MLVLGIDVETTGLNNKKDRIIEIGAVLWDTARNIPIKLLSEIVTDPDIVISEKITDITGISQDDLKYGIKHSEALTRLSYMAVPAGYYVAHNAAFDKGFLEAEAKRYAIPMADLPWVDTLSDIPYPKEIRVKSLKYLAADHDILNLFSHRAVFDVLTMLKVMSCYNFDSILEHRKQPTLKAIAEVTYEERNLAKSFNYRWDSKEKIWFKNIKECNIEEETRLVPFKVNYIKE